jgi:hypothetical protein
MQSDRSTRYASAPAADAGRYATQTMRVFAAAVLVFFLNEAHGRGVPIEHQIMEEDFIRFSQAHYPGLEFELFLPSSSNYWFGFSYLDKFEHTIYSCDASYYGNSGEVFLVSCLDQKNRTWPPTTHTYAFIKENGDLVDVKTEIFPLADIFDQLQYFIIDNDEVRNLLSNAEANPTVYDFLDFNLQASEDDLLVTIGPIKGVIEGAAYTSMVWDDKQKSFQINN